MTRPHLLVMLVLATLTAVAGRPLLGQRARRHALAGGASSVDDPLVAWVTSLRHDVPAPEGRRRPDQNPTARGAAGDRAGAGSASAAGERAGAWSASAPGAPGGRTPAELDDARASAATERSSDPSRAAVGLDGPATRRPTGKSGPVGPPQRRDSRRPGGTPPPAADRRRVGSTAAGPLQPSSRRRWLAVLAATPRRTLLLTGVVAASLGALLGGPVAAVAAGAYGAVAARGLLRRQASRHAERARRRRLDQLCELAADLRAGLPVGQAVALSTDGGSAGSLVRAAVQLADRTGAPLAELLERIDLDARAAERGLAAAAAQAAGARATAWLLAALPLGGIGLGYGIGVDPVAVLLNTPVGGGCAVLAVLLQVAGLLWAERLTSTPRRDL